MHVVIPVAVPFSVVKVTLTGTSAWPLFTILILTEPALSDTVYSVGSNSTVTTTSSGEKVNDVINFMLLQQNKMSMLPKSLARLGNENWFPDV